jgi:hypothetical protein
MNNTRDPSPSTQSYDNYSNLRRRPAQRGPPPDFYVMQSDSTGTYIEHWHAPQGNMQRVSAIRNGVRTGDVAYELDNPQDGSLTYELRAPVGVRPASDSGQSKRSYQSQPFQTIQPDFQIPHGPKPFEGEEEAVQKSLEDLNAEVAIQKILEDEAVARQEAEAVRRSLEDQRIVQQEIEEHEVLLRALARQEALLTRFSEQRTDAREFREQEGLVAQLRERLLGLER